MIHSTVISRRSDRPAGKAFTLTELIVSVAVLAIVMMIVSRIMSDTQKVVTGSQTMLRVNGRATAIGQIVQQDLAGVSGNGLLCITVGRDGEPMLILATAGPAHSLAHVGGANRAGNGRLIAYGICEDEQEPRVLWRGGWVMTGQVASPMSDLLGIQFAEIQSMSRASLSDMLTELIVDPNDNDPFRPDRLPERPVNLSELQELWKFLAGRCENLSIMWTDGTRNGSNEIQWYGLQSGGGVRQKTGGWGGREASDTDGDGLPYTEFNANPGGDRVYRALWSHHNPNDWPQAIRLRFTLSDPSDDEDEDPTWYEFVAPVPK